MGGLPRTEERNRQIFAEFQSGVPIETLAARHRLNALTIKAILTAERHKIAVSPRYREFRIHHAP